MLPHIKGGFKFQAIDFKKDIPQIYGQYFITINVKQSQ